MLHHSLCTGRVMNLSRVHCDATLGHSIKPDLYASPALFIGRFYQHVSAFSAFSAHQLTNCIARDLCDSTRYAATFRMLMTNVMFHFMTMNVRGFYFVYVVIHILSLCLHCSLQLPVSLCYLFIISGYPLCVGWEQYTD
jgi:hypothetical protein